MCGGVLLYTGYDVFKKVFFRQYRTCFYLQGDFPCRAIGLFNEISGLIDLGYQVADYLTAILSAIIRIFCNNRISIIIFTFVTSPSSS